MRENTTKIIPRRFEAVVDLLYDAAQVFVTYGDTLQQHVTGWAEISGLPESLMPPQINITEEMFILGSPEANKGKRRREKRLKGKPLKGKRRKR